MLEKPAEIGAAAHKKLASYLIQPLLVALLPSLCLLLYWASGEIGLFGMALIWPVLCIFATVGAPRSDRTLMREALRGNLQRDGFHEIVQEYFREVRETGLKSAVFQIEIDDHDTVVERHGQSAARQVAQTCASRLLAILRENDAVAQTSDFGVSICLAPTHQLDLELCIQLAGRMQTAMEKPIAVDGTSIYVTGSIGFCQHTRVLSKSGDDWTRAASYALKDAQQNGPAAIRAYSEEIRRKAETRFELREEVSEALETGQIQPWFQPQISTNTGLVTGFEALARWNHPNKGMISPATFLPVIEQAGMLERLAEVMMYHSLTALKAWDCAGVDVPQVGVNFAGPELSNPKLVEKIKWELDRFELAPERLAVEVLETVVAGAPDDTITLNINALNKLGCKIDLDDFGTGTASIASIRRFSVNRIKIDRSFVIKADRDPEQQRMIGAILTMAERLEIETLAEGVETVGEHALLAQLGCDHVQGFGIGKPMPFDQTLDWIRNHNAKLQATPKILGNKSMR